MSEQVEATPTPGDAETGPVNDDSMMSQLEDYLARTVDGPLTEDSDKPATEEVADEDREEVSDEEASEEAESERDEEQKADADEIELDAETLANALGVDEDAIEVNEDGKLQIRVKVDGKESTVNLADLRKGYQLEAHTQNRSQKLAEEAKRFEAERTEHLQYLQQTMQNLQATEQVLVNEFQSDYQGVDWDRLRREDPAEFSAMQQEFANRQQRIQQMIGQSRQAQQQALQQYQARQAQAAEQLKAQNFDKLHDLIPDWKDEGKFTEGKKALREYLKGNGFSDNEINGVYDARAISMARKAMLYDQMMDAKQQAGKKKVRKNVRVVKAGKPKTDQQRDAKKSRDLLTRAKKSQREDDWLNVISDRLGL